MPTLQLSPFARGLLALAALLLALLLLVLLVALPLRSWHHRYDERLEAMQEQLQRYRRLARDAPALQAGLAQAQAAAPGRHFISGDDPAASLRESVETVFSAGGGKLLALQPLPASEEGRFRRLAVTLQGSLGSEALRRVLHELESGEPWLFVERLSLRSPYGQRNPPPPGTDPEFAVEMNITAYTRVTPGSTPP